MRSDSALSAKAVTLCTNSVRTVTGAPLSGMRLTVSIRHLRFLRNESWERHSNDPAVEPVQHACQPLDVADDSLGKPSIEEHQLERIETDRQVKKLILLAWCAAIIADHDHLSELLLRLSWFQAVSGKRCDTLSIPDSSAGHRPFASRSARNWDGTAVRDHARVASNVSYALR